MAESSLDGIVGPEDIAFLKKWHIFAEKMIHRMKTDGQDMKFGDTENCLSYREIKLISSYQYEEMSKSRSEYEVHLSECSDCDYLVKEFQEYLELTRPVE